MLQGLQELGKELGRDIVRGWESLTEGWQELLSRSSSALTRRRNARICVRVRLSRVVMIPAASLAPESMKPGGSPGFGVGDCVD